jgi:hypothetical protein
MTALRADSSAARLQARVQADRARIANGERPVYRATWTDKSDGSADVTIDELPLIHVYVPDHDRVPDGARGLIARTLAVDQASFEVLIQEPTARGDTADGPSLDARSR